MGQPILLEDAGVSLGGQRILHGATLELGPGQVLGIAGHNGSGKTTLLRLLATLVAPDSGLGTVLGAALGTDEVYAVRKRIGMIGHIPSVIGELTLRENIDHAVRLRGDDPGRVETALRVVGLDEAGGRRAESCSFGMLRRTEIGRLLITEPDLLLLDEAYGGLDGEAQELVDALVSRTSERGGATVVVSHDTGHLGRLTDRVMTLQEGRLVPVA